MENKNGLTQVDANKIAIALNVLFNNATFYGGVHPSTVEKAKDLALILQEFFKKSPMITLMSSGKALNIDKWPVSSKMNVGRLISAFQNAGIESISFDHGMKSSDVVKFIDIYTDEKLPKVANKNSALEKAGITSVKFNYVFYRKVTKDDVVVDSDSALKLSAIKKMGVELSDAKKTPSDSSALLDNLNRIFTLKELFESDDSSETGKFSSAEVITKLRDARKSIESSDVSEVDPDELVFSVLSLTSELKHGIEVQKEMGKILTGDEELLSEADNLTFTAVCKIVRDEYKKGSISVKRLSLTIKRIVPSVSEIKKLMPLLKKALIEEGMPLVDFLELTKEIYKETESDELFSLLSKGAGELGLDVSDIVEILKKNPEESARLIVLASELKGLVATEKSDLSNLITDYIEQAGSEIAEAQAREDELTSSLDTVIYRIENELLQKLKLQGVDESTLSDVQKELGERFPKTLNKIKTDLMIDAVSEQDSLSTTHILKLLDNTVPSSKDFESIKDRMEAELKQRGFDDNEIEHFFSDIKRHIDTGSKDIKFPKYVIKGNNAKFFLQRYIREYKRYGNDFSGINITPSIVVEDGLKRFATYEEVSVIVPQVVKILKQQLRDLDLICSLDNSKKEKVFLILPMTDSTGSQIVKSRIESILMTMTFGVGSKGVKIEPVITVLQFDMQKHKTITDFISEIELKHTNELKIFGL